jgi:hypothetical protein
MARREALERRVRDRVVSACFAIRLLSTGALDRHDVLGQGVDELSSGALA